MNTKFAVIMCTYRIEGLLGGGWGVGLRWCWGRAGVPGPFAALGLVVLLVLLGLVGLLLLLGGLLALLLALPAGGRLPLEALALRCLGRARAAGRLLQQEAEHVEQEEDAGAVEVREEPLRGGNPLLVEAMEQQEYTLAGN